MTERASSLFARDDRPLIGVIVREDGEEITRYFTDEEEADAATPSASVQRALRALGAWSDLDWDDAVTQLDGIRHDSRPTPRIEL
jgi:hypothetical protein